jgi:hypothetical protein
VIRHHKFIVITTFSCFLAQIFYIQQGLELLRLHLANGLAQRQQRDGRDSYHSSGTSGKSRLRGAAEPLSAGAGVRRCFYSKAMIFETAVMLTHIFFCY